MIAQASDSGAGAVLVIIFVIFGIAVYFIPTIVAAIRKVPNIGSIIVINVFLGWSLIGWVVALAMAARTTPPPPQQVIVQQPPPRYIPPPAPPTQGGPAAPGRPPEPPST